MKVRKAQVHRRFKAADDHRNVRLRVRGVNCAKQHDRKHRPDRAQGNEAEAVRLGIFVASNGRNADAECHDERHGHRPRCHAAGVERDGEDTLIRQKRRGKDDGVKYDQHRAQRDRKENAHHAQHQKEADADRNGQDQHRCVDLRHVAREHLQIRLRHRDGDAEGEAHGQDERQLARFRQLGAHVVADAAHRHVRAQREEPHAENQHGRGDHEREHQSRVYRHEHKADRHNDQADGQDGGGGFFQLFH